MEVLSNLISVEGEMAKRFELRTEYSHRDYPRTVHLKGSAQISREVQYYMDLSRVSIFDHKNYIEIQLPLTVSLDYADYLCGLLDKAVSGEG